MVATYNDASSNYLEFASADLPTSWLYGTGSTDSFIIGMWVRRDTEGSGVYRCPFLIQNLFTFRGSQRNWGFRAISDSAELGTAGATQGVDVYEDWCFWLAGWDKGTNTIFSCTKNSLAGVKFASASATMTTHTPGKAYVMKNHVSGDGGATTVSAWLGHVMSVTVKKFQLSTQATIEAIVGDIYDSKDPLGLISYVGNGLNGESDSEWFSFNCTIPQFLSKTIIAGATDGARFGQAIIGGATTNYAWQRKGSGVTESGEWDVARGVTVSGTVNFIDHEGIDAGFFLRPPPGDQTDGINSVNAPFAKRLHDNTPSGIERVCAWSNSRGVRPTWYPAGPSQPDWCNWPAAHVNGFIALRQSKTLGVFNSSFPSSTTRRFAHDCETYPRSSGVSQLQTTANWRDFTAWWTGSGTSDDIGGPGRGMILSGSGSYVSMKARKMTGSYLDGVQGTGWAHKIYYMKFPGSCNSIITKLEESSAQDVLGTYSGLGTITNGLDTTQVTRSFTVSDSYNEPAMELEFAGTGLGIQAGWSVVITGGTGLGSVAYIDSVDDTGVVTTLFLSHPFDTAPSAGSSDFSFGPVSVGTISHNGALPTAEFQGIYLEHNGSASSKLILLGADVYARGISDGWVWAYAGWGAHGYQPQMVEAAPGALSAIFTTLGMTGLLMFNATQNTTTTQRDTFAGVAAAALGGVEKLVICCDQDHRTDNQTATWGIASLAQSTYPAAVGTESAFIGDNSVQFATGQAQNGAHPSIEGQYALAQAYLGDGVTAGIFDGFEDVGPPISTASPEGSMRRNERPWRGRP